METLTHWVARRSGAAITIRGLNPQGKTVHIVNVERIEPSQDTEGRPCIVATAAGRLFKLEAVS